MTHFGDHQVSIYAAGMLAGQTPAWTTDLASLERHAADHPELSSAAAD